MEFLLITVLLLFCLAFIIAILGFTITSLPAFIDSIEDTVLALRRLKERMRKDDPPV